MPATSKFGNLKSNNRPTLGMTRRRKSPASRALSDPPKPVLQSDLKYPKSDDNTYQSFQMHETISMGWVIPVLQISGARRGQSTARSYAICLNGKGMCSVGNGPHILQTVTVYVSKKRLAALQPLLDLKLEGEQRAGTIRDRRSSRRAEGVEKRAAGYSSWLWSK